MKALAIDTATSKFSVAAKNDAQSVSTIYDIGMKQSESLLPAIDFVLGKLGIKPQDLDYTAITAGPGSFTGLRLAFAACKALTLANGTPLYTVPTLEAMAWSYRNIPCYAVPLIDAKKNKFYSAIYFQGETVLEQGDYEIEKIFEKLKTESQNSEGKAIEILSEYTESHTKTSANISKYDVSNCQLLLVGNDAELFMERVNNNEKLTAIKNNYRLAIINSQLITDAIFELAEKSIAENVPPALDYDAPLYIRASEAEEKLM